MNSKDVEHIIKIKIVQSLQALLIALYYWQYKYIFTRQDRLSVPLSTLQYKVCLCLSNNAVVQYFWSKVQSKLRQSFSKIFWDLISSPVTAFVHYHTMRDFIMVLFVFHQVWLLPVLHAVKVSPLIEKVSDHKDFKKLLRTRTNVLVVYTKTGK